MKGVEEHITGSRRSPQQSSSQFSWQRAFHLHSLYLFDNYPKTLPFVQKEIHKPSPTANQEKSSENFKEKSAVPKMMQKLEKKSLGSPEGIEQFPRPGFLSTLWSFRMIIGMLNTTGITLTWYACRFICMVFLSRQKEKSFLSRSGGLERERGMEEAWEGEGCREAGKRS